MGSARELFGEIQAELSPHDDDNRMVPSIAAGEAPREVFATIAAEELRIVRSDWRSVLTLAARAEEPTAREFFAGMAGGERLALGKLPALASAAGLDETALRDYRPRPGCQAYPAFFAWMALNGEPADVILALVANFAAWGRYCASIAAAMRAHYGFPDEACGFFDFFAEPVPGMEEQALAAVQAGMDAGRVSGEVWTYARLFQSYELMFWNSLG